MAPLRCQLLVGGDGSIVVGSDDDEGDEDGGNGSSGETLLQTVNGRQVRTHRPHWIPSKELR